MNILEDFTFSYGVMDKEYFLDELHKKRPRDHFEITSTNTECLFNVFIEELDKTNNLLFTGKQIKSKHYDLKDGIFVFAGTIHNNDSESINLIKNTIKNKSFNQFLKNIEITHGIFKDLDKVEIIRSFKFKGYVSNFYEYYDRFGNYNFEFVICRRRVLYKDNIFIKRLSNGLLAIGKVQEPAKITIPIAKTQKEYERKIKKGKLKKLQVGNTFWAIGGICLATLGIIGTIGTGGVATIAITVLYGANTIFSNGYSIYLDYNERDEEMDLDTFYNNPLKFSMGQLFALKNEKGREVGHAIYYGTEIFLGAKGLRELAKGFKVKTLFKTRNISMRHPVLGELQGKEKVLIREKVLFEGYQFSDGIRGVNNNINGFRNSVEKYESSL